MARLAEWRDEGSLAGLEEVEAELQMKRVVFEEQEMVEKVEVVKAGLLLQ